MCFQCTTYKRLNLLFVFMIICRNTLICAVPNTGVFKLKFSCHISESHYVATELHQYARQPEDQMFSPKSKCLDVSEYLVYQFKLLHGLLSVTR